MALHPTLEFATRADTLVLTDEAAADRGVSVVFTTRSGGVSPGAFESLNLSTAMGDDPDLVTANRNVVAAAVGVEAGSLKLARQVHGAEVLDCDAGVADLGQGDALVTRSRGTAVGVLTADCVPVLVLGDDGIVAIHAGWRGIVAGVIDRALERIERPLAAWVGPSIHACCYEVGPDVTSAFDALALPIADPRHVDPSAAACTQLRRAGVERIAASSLCTSCDDRLFSHRRAHRTGRQGGFIALL